MVFSLLLLLLLLLSAPSSLRVLQSFSRMLHVYKSNPSDLSRDRVPVGVQGEQLRLDVAATGARRARRAAAPGPDRDLQPGAPVRGRRQVQLDGRALRESQVVEDVLFFLEAGKREEKVKGEMRWSMQQREALFRLALHFTHVLPVFRFLSRSLP